MSAPILHSYDASPFTQKALKMLGIKGMRWSWVETPMMPPKEALLALTGGYRGTPVLQLGADVFVDSQRIARELDRLQPEPPLLPAGLDGLGLMLVKWSDAFFRTALYRAIDQTVAEWDAAFLDDRRHLFPDVDFDAVAAGVQHRTEQFLAHLALLDRQLADGRAFLGGEAPTLLDVQAWPFVWMSLGLEGTAPMLERFPRVGGWQQRVDALGEGERQSLDARAALERARAADPAPAGAVDPADPSGLTAGQPVQVSPDDTRRGTVTGELVALSPEAIAVRHRNEAVGEVQVHFPRLGYEIRAG